VAFYGDPDELDRLAKVLDGHAAAVRQLTADQLSRARTANWVSPAATAYQNLLVAKCRQADEAADGIEAAAAILRGHAEQIRRLLAAIDRIEQVVKDWMRAVARAVEDAVESGAAVMGQPPWMSWPVRYQPQALPPPGDKAWLDVGQFMRRAGVL
jgi:hypothetical protein